MIRKQIFLLLILTLIFVSCKEQSNTQEDPKDKLTISNEKIDRKKLDEKLVETNKTWDSLSNQMRSKELNKFQEDSLQRLFNDNKKQQETIFKDFILKNPNSLVSIETLNGFKFSWGKDITKKLFKSLSPAIKSSDKGEIVQEYIKYYRNPEISDKYSDFILPNSKGDTIRISNNLNDYTLLEFWASWCSGCRKEHPELIKVFEKYKDRNFTVISISSDTNDENWLNAIEKDNLPWINLRDPNGRESIVQYQYGIHVIPTNFLIGPNKEIIAKNIEPKELDKLLKEELSETAHNIG
ncbi:peroxiredoxin [Gillisia mitskevichiae]|uniref:Peroxiredoxin n=1 Tax=Gillisia mitskevichiae TaxID=270921 RepID=A0A495NY06_9FLAO|nr:TlpA disulfide reductase family protein [Gillisia mitskevichiae]RKS42746.1 peroxiredoxin [Gillisia mitskevichiae]